jgi:hypothetical protein
MNVGGCSIIDHLVVWGLSGGRMVLETLTGRARLQSLLGACLELLVRLSR